MIGDELRLRQVWLNLLGNAVKFTERGEVSLKVWRAHDDTFFQIADSGIGMTPEQLAQVFSAFEQADTSTTRQFGGSGLGLTISRNLVELMGGDIDVHSEAGVGSVFTVRVPLPETSAQQDTVAPEAVDSCLAGLRVLAAEDVELNRLILQDLLEHEGASVIFAENGQQALDRLAEHGTDAFDVVLMDVQMPLMDGYGAARRIAEIAPDLPVIGLTAHALAEERDKCLAAGMVDHVAKPINVPDLIAAICRQVSKKSGASPTGSAGIAPAPAAMAQPSADTPFAGCDDPALIDLSILAGRVGNDPAKIAKFGTRFLDSARGTLAEMGAALTSEDMRTLGGLAHRLKSPALTVGALRFGEICQEIERMESGNDLAAAQARVEQLRALLERIVQRMEGVPRP